MARIRHTLTPPHIRTIAPTVKNKYIGNLTYKEFDIIDMFRCETDAMDPSMIAMRMGWADEATARLTRDWKHNGLFEVVFDGMLQSDLTQEMRIGNVWGVKQEKETTRISTMRVQNRWLPTNYAYDQWHLALGEDPNDPRHQYYYRTLEDVRAVWKARHVDATRECHSDPRQRNVRRKAAQRARAIRIRDVSLGSGYPYNELQGRD